MEDEYSALKVTVEFIPNSQTNDFSDKPSRSVLPDRYFRMKSVPQETPGGNCRQGKNSGVL